LKTTFKKEEKLLKSVIAEIAELIDQVVGSKKHPMLAGKPKKQPK